MKFLPLAGTHSWTGKLSGEWWQDGSEYLAFMATQGFVPYDPEDPFVWDTGLGGLPIFGTTNWYAAGLNLRHYNGFKGPIRIVAHSHGGQVAAYAAARGLKIYSLVTIGTPVRADMYPIWTAARKNIRYWTHVYSDWSDKTQLLGSLFDGAFGIERRFIWTDVFGIRQGANKNLGLPGVGHSGLIRTPKHFAKWEEAGLLEDLRG